MRMRAAILFPLVFMVGFIVSSQSMLWRGKQDIHTEVQSADILAATLATMLSNRLIYPEELATKTYRHIRISPLPPSLITKDKEDNVPNWFLSLLGIDDKPPAQRYPATLGPLEVWTVYATPMDEAEELWDSIVWLFWIFSLSALICFGLVRANIRAMLEQIHSINKAMQQAADDADPAPLNTQSPLGELEQTAKAFNKAMAKLGENRAEIEALSMSLINTQDEERHRLAIELHDNLCQMLSGLRVQVFAYSRRHQRTVDIDSSYESETKLLTDLEQGLEGCLKATRIMIRQLDPVDFEISNLTEMVTELTALWESQNNIPVILDLDIATLPKTKQSTKLSLHLYRILQEALQNIQKHASPDKVSVQLYVSRQLIDLKVSNDGVTGAEGTPSYGLRSMKERTRHIGCFMTAGSSQQGQYQVHVHGEPIFDRSKISLGALA